MYCFLLPLPFVDAKFAERFSRTERSVRYRSRFVPRRPSRFRFSFLSRGAEARARAWKTFAREKFCFRTSRVNECAFVGRRERMNG